MALIYSLVDDLLMYTGEVKKTKEFEVITRNMYVHVLVIY